MKAFVRNKWKQSDSGKWYAEMLTVDKNGFDVEKLEKGLKLNFEVGGKRRCTGYWNKDREMVPCPGFREINRGSQCRECKNKDIYNDYVEGEGKSPRDEESHSVYLVQSGDAVKVGVVRTARKEKRWVEQGADWAVEIYSGLTSLEALKKEKEISKKGYSQRIRKESKINNRNSNNLEKTVEKLGHKTKEIENVKDRTIYPEINTSKLQRTGLFSGTVQSVKGNIIYTRNQSIALTEGKVLEKPKQKGLNSY